MKQVKSTVKTEIEWHTKHWAIISDLLPLTLVLLKERWCQRSLDYSQTSPLIEICNNFNDALTYLPFFSFKCRHSVVLHIILLEVAPKLSHFCKMARR